MDLGCYSLFLSKYSKNKERYLKKQKTSAFAIIIGKSIWKEFNMILITGANGQLGTELRHLLGERNEEYVAVDVAEMDITNAEKVDGICGK